MMNISENTKITGWTGKAGTLQQAFYDRNLHRGLSFSYYGPRVQRGMIELLLCGEWRVVSFDCLNGWLRAVEVL